MKIKKRTIRDFAIIHCIDEDRSKKILKFFLENFTEDTYQVLCIAYDTVKYSPSTIENFYNFCESIIKEFPDTFELEELNDLSKKLSNIGIKGKDASKVIKQTIEAFENRGC